MNNSHVPSPQVTRALLWQLVNGAGVTNQPDITIADPTRCIAAPLWDKCHGEFPNARYVDRIGGDGRIAAQHDPNVAIHFADTNVWANGARYVAACFTEADYVINVALLRGHNFAGITLNAKNHFGSTWVNWTNDWTGGWTPGGPDDMNGMHGYCNAHDVHWGGNWEFTERPPASYNALVELMGHKDLGGKTLLFMVDALYAAEHQSSSGMVKWQMAPFNDDWTSSLFASQDEVAIESVGFDFLRSEPQYAEIVYGTVDDYLHEAAQADSPPSGSQYDPEGDGSPLASLGVHEHWNNATDRQYSRNLGTGAGIELVNSDPTTPPDPHALPDEWVLLFFGSIGAPGSGSYDDPDHDGMVNWAEYTAGTDPTNAASRLEIMAATWPGGTNSVLEWQSASGRTYSVLTTTNLLNPVWSTAAVGIASTPPLGVWTAIPSPVASGFFRVRVE